jgi:fructose-bisphosphate aldolase class I
MVLRNERAASARSKDQKTTTRHNNTKKQHTGGYAMASRDLERFALTLVADGKGILAAETVPTLTRRFDTLGIKSAEQSRRTYREMLFTSPGAAEFISGVIMYDETVRQKSSRGMPLAEALAVQGVVPGIKVDTGAKPLAGSPDETVTEGLDGLRNRLLEYRSMGARFAKWRAVIRVTDALPTSACVSANAHALARYAALCQEQELVPVVEPEVLMDGAHTVARSEEVTGLVLHAVFNALFEQDVALEAMLLKPNMVLAGKACTRQASVERLPQGPCAACAGTCPPPFLVSYSCQAARTHVSRPCISMRLIGCPARSRGRSASPTGGRFRIRRWRRGMGGTRIWRPVKLRCTAEPVAMAQRALGNTRKKWSWNR